MNGRGREQFKQIIAAEVEPDDQARRDEILAPLRDLVEAIDESGVGAEIVPGPGGRLTLTLWPRHRPALRSLMLPFVYDRGELIALLSAGRRSFRTADELRKFLAEFAARPEFKASLAYLREQAHQPVEAVLRSVDRSLMIEIGAGDQQRLGEAPPEQEIELTLALAEGENVPSTFAPTSLASAGLQFKVVSSRTQDRAIWLRVLKDGRPTAWEQLQHDPWE